MKGYVDEQERPGRFNITAMPLKGSQCTAAGFAKIGRYLSRSFKARNPLFMFQAGTAFSNAIAKYISLYGTLGDGQEPMVQPLPALLYSLARQRCSSSVYLSNKVYDLKRTEWTLLILTSKSMNGRASISRYAFISADGMESSKLQIKSLEDVFGQNFKFGDMRIAHDEEIRTLLPILRKFYERQQQLVVQDMENHQRLQRGDNIIWSSKDEDATEIDGYLQF
jgi:hypothetical protein